MKNVFIASALALLSLSAGAASLGQPDGSPVRLGDTVEAVQKALNTTQEPDKEASVIPLVEPSSVIRLKTKGLYVYFSNAKTVKSIRFEPPFNGRVIGVAIGDSKEKVVERLGEPVKKTKLGPSSTLNTLSGYYYYPDDLSTVVFTISAEGAVQSIQVVK